MNIHRLLQDTERQYSAKLNSQLVADQPDALPAMETRMIDMHRAIQTGDHAFWFRRYFQTAIAANFAGLALAVLSNNAGAKVPFAIGCGLAFVLLLSLWVWASAERDGDAGLVEGAISKVLAIGCIGLFVWGVLSLAT